MAVAQMVTEPRLRDRLADWRCGQCNGLLSKVNLEQPCELIVKCHRCNAFNVLRVVFGNESR